MPMGPYKDFSACLIAQRKKGHSKDIAAKICGYIKKKTEGAINEEEAEKAITRLETASWLEQEVLSTREAEMYGGKKRSELKDSDFLFPAKRAFPIVTPADVSDAISNFGRMKGNMSYEVFLRKLLSFVKRKGSDFVSALPEATKKKLKDMGLM